MASAALLSGQFLHVHYLLRLLHARVRGSPLTNRCARKVGRADVFVLPSRGEGWGLPITEAMALQGGFEQLEVLLARSTRRQPLVHGVKHDSKVLSNAQL